MNDTDVLKHHLLDLARQAESRSMYTFSGFLGLAEQDTYVRMAPELSFIGHTLYGGSEAAERQIAVFGSEADFGYPPEYPIAVLSVTPAAEKYAEALTHRDYLGAILSLGIERELIGDIIIRDKHAWFYALDSIADFLADSLTSVKHTTVVCRREIGLVPELAPILETLSVNVASERIDAVISALTGLSRNHVGELFTKERVTLNGRIILKESTALKEGDVLSARGFGKYIYDGITGRSRKDRLYVSLRKYV